MRKKIFVVASALVALGTMVAIWRFSAQSGAESSSLSGSLAAWVVQVPVLGEMWQFGGLEGVLRKMAHGTVYFVLGMSLAGALVGRRAKIVVWLVPLIGVIYAAIDEIHQSFVPGRNPSVFDVMIDGAGVVLGMTLMIMVLRKHYRFERLS